MANLRDTFRDMTPDEKREASRLAEECQLMIR